MVHNRRIRSRAILAPLGLLSFCLPVLAPGAQCADEWRTDYSPVPLLYAEVHDDTAWDEGGNGVLYPMLQDSSHSPLPYAPLAPANLDGSDTRTEESKKSGRRGLRLRRRAKEGKVDDSDAKTTNAIQPHGDKKNKNGQENQEALVHQGDIGVQGVSPQSSQPAVLDNYNRYLMTGEAFSASAFCESMQPPESERPTVVPEKQTPLQQRRQPQENPDPAKAEPDRQIPKVFLEKTPDKYLALPEDRDALRQENRIPPNADLVSSTPMSKPKNQIRSMDEQQEEPQKQQPKEMHTTPVESSKPQAPAGKSSPREPRPMPETRPEPPAPPAIAPSAPPKREQFGFTVPPTRADVEDYRGRLEARLLERYNNLPQFIGKVGKVSIILSKPLQDSLDGSMIKAEFDQLVYDPWGKRIPALEQEYFVVTFGLGGARQVRSDPSIRVGLDREKTYSERVPLVADPFQNVPERRVFEATPKVKMPDWWRPDFKDLEQ